MFSYEQRIKAVKLYLKYKSWAAVIHELGYTNRDYLKRWLIERDPQFKYTCRKSSSLVQFTEEDKKQAFIDLCIRNTSASYVAEQYHTSRTSLYNWKNELFEDKELKIMSKKKSKSKDELQDEWC